jgi:DNA-directed RNA polymerase specialized sigma24 family protein
MADSLSLAFLVLLETLSPEQRAAFLLREVFDYPYDQIAAIVATGEQNARQLVARARRHVEHRRPGSSRRASNGSAWPDGSSPPPRTATSARSRSCWPTT